MTYLEEINHCINSKEEKDVLIKHCLHIDKSNYLHKLKNDKSEILAVRNSWNESKFTPTIGGYALMFASLGNGITVFDRLANDDRPLAWFSDIEGEDVVQFYTEIPSNVKKSILKARENLIY